MPSKYAVPEGHYQLISVEPFCTKRRVNRPTCARIMLEYVGVYLKSSTHCRSSALNTLVFSATSVVFFFLLEDVLRMDVD